MAKRIGRFTGTAPWEHNREVAARKAVQRYETGQQLSVDDVIILITNIGNAFALAMRTVAGVLAEALEHFQLLDPTWCGACYVDAVDGHLFTGNCRHTPIEADL